MVASDATTVAKTNDVAAPSPKPSPSLISRYHVQSLTGSYEVFGVDAIWQNLYAGPASDFFGFRKQYNCDINVMILKVAEHVLKGVYTVISMNATPHMLSVVCACEKFQADFPQDIWDDSLD